LSEESLRAHDEEGDGHAHGHGHGEKPPSIITAVAAGIINWLLMFGLCCAYGMIMFGEDHIAKHRGLGVKMNLSTAMLMGLLLAVVSKIPVAIGGPDLNPVIFIASFITVIAKDLAGQLGLPNYPVSDHRRLSFTLGHAMPGPGELIRRLGSGGTSTSADVWCEGAAWASYSSLCEEYHDSLRATVIFTVACSSAILGLLFFVLGRFRLTKFVSFVPTSVMEAFLSCVGYKVFYYALKFCKFKPLQFIPAAIIGVTMYFMKSMHIGNPAVVIPLLLFIPLGIFYIIIFASNGSEALSDDGVKKYMFPKVTNIGFWHVWTDSIGNAHLINFKAWAKTLPDLGVMLIVCLIDCLLKVSSTENKLPVKVAKDYEVQLYGLGNVLTTCFGSSVGYMQLKFNVINFGVMGNSKDRRGSIFYALACAACFFGQIEQFNFLPRFFLGVLLFFAGAGFVAENLWGSRLYLSLAEWCEILLILLVFILSGQLLYAVGAGIMITCFSFIMKYSKVSCVVGRPLRGGEVTSHLRRLPLEKMNIQHIMNSQLLVVKLKGYIFFASAQSLTKRLMAMIEDEEKRHVPPYRRLAFVILDCEMLDGMDASASKAFKKLSTDARSANVMILWSEVTPSDQADLKKRSIIHHDWECFPNMSEAVLFVEEHAVKYRSKLQDTWLSLHPFFALQQQLTLCREVFEPFQHILLGSSRYGCPWRFCTKVQLVKHVTLLWEPGQRKIPLFLLHVGKVALFKCLPSDRGEWTEAVAVYSHGSFLNREALIHAPSRYYAVAIEDGEALCWDEENWCRMTMAHPAMASHLMRAVMKQQAQDCDAQFAETFSGDVEPEQEDAPEKDDELKEGVEKTPQRPETAQVTTSNIPDTMQVRLRGVQIAQALGSSNLYEPIAAHEKSMLPEMPPVLREDLHIAFNTYATVQDGVSRLDWDKAFHALMYAGVGDMPLIDVERQSLTGDAFISLGQNASMARLSTSNVSACQQAFRNHCTPGTSHLMFFQLKQVLEQSFGVQATDEHMVSISQEWGSMEEISEARFLAIMSRLLRQHERDWNLLRGIQDIVGHSGSFLQNKCTAEALIKAAAARSVPMNQELADEMIWCADIRERGQTQANSGMELSDMLCAVLFSSEQHQCRLPPKPRIPADEGKNEQQTFAVDELIEGCGLVCSFHGAGGVDAAMSASAWLQKWRNQEQQNNAVICEDEVGEQPHKICLEDVKEDEEIPIPNTCRAKAHLILEDPASSQVAAAISLIMGLLIVISIFTMFVQPLVPSKKGSDDPSDKMWYYCEFVLTVIFSIEFVMRLFVASALNTMTTVGFLKQPSNILDFVAILPFYIESTMNLEGEEFRLFRIVRLLRLTRIARLGRLAKRSALFGPVAMVLIVIWGIYMRTSV